MDLGGICGSERGFGVFWGIVREFWGPGIDVCLGENWSVSWERWGRGFVVFWGHLCCREWMRVNCGQELCGDLEVQGVIVGLSGDFGAVVTPPAP